jgi:lipid-A-disaccharide synthase
VHVIAADRITAELESSAKTSRATQALEVLLFARGGLAPTGESWQIAAMRIFVCAGEPSGDIHGANLIRCLKAIDPASECVGYGGEHMAAAGCRLHYPLVNLAVMWFARVLANAPTFLRLLSEADRYFRHHRPDAVVLIDYPGFNWWMARRAHFHNIPVYYFVPPQLWAWAGWRIKKMRRYVDHVLCSLPFEEAWYQERGVRAEYVGHPFFDECPQQRLDQAFLDQQRAADGNIIAILPGSRTQEIEKNLSTQIRAAFRIHKARPDTRFLVACFRPHQQQIVDDYLKRHPGLPIQTRVGRTPEIIELAKACVSVSGSVALELLYRQKPSVIVYRIGRLDLRVARHFMTTPYICLVNLLAKRELYPEFLTDRCEAEGMANHVLCWLDDPRAYEAAVIALRELRAQVGQPGACQRAAQHVLDSLSTATKRAA